MNRRRFLSLFGLAAAAAVVDPERLLWTPGEKTIFVPPVQGWGTGIDFGYGRDFSVRYIKSFESNFTRYDVIYGMRNIENDPAFQARIAECAKELADDIDRRCVETFFEREHRKAEFRERYIRPAIEGLLNRGTGWPDGA